MSGTFSDGLSAGPLEMETPVAGCGSPHPQSATAEPLKPPPRDPLRFSPLFVLATARSYSSVVTTMIGQHPELAGLPELKLFCCDTIGDLEASLPRFWIERGVAHRSPGLVRAVAELLFGGQTADAVSVARAWLRARPDWSGSNVLDCLLERLSPRTAVEKSPDNLLTDDGLSRMAAAYPRARYLHLTRHPVTTQRSIEEHRRQTVGHPQDGEPMRSIAFWYDVHRRILHFAADLPPQRHLRVRAEDVLNDPKPHLERITAWLGIRSDEDAIEAMRHPEASPFAHPGAGSGVTGGNDPSFLRDPVPRRVAVCGTLEPPRGWSADPAVWKMVADLANRLGYV